MIRIDKGGAVQSSLTSSDDSTLSDVEIETTVNSFRCYQVERCGAQAGDASSGVP